MGADDGFIGVVGDPDIHGGEILSVVEDGDTILVTLRRTVHRGLEARDSAPHLEVRFDQVKDVAARRELGMIVESLSEMRGEPPWRRFVFLDRDDTSDGKLEVWAREIAWSDVERHPCPCCGFRTLDEAPPGTHDICRACGWQDDLVQIDDPSNAGEPHPYSLRGRRAAFVQELADDPGKERSLTAEWGPRVSPPS